MKAELCDLLVQYGIKWVTVIFRLVWLCRRFHHIGCLNYWRFCALLQNSKLTVSRRHKFLDPAVRVMCWAEDDKLSSHFFTISEGKCPSRSCCQSFFSNNLACTVHTHSKLLSWWHVFCQRLNYFCPTQRQTGGMLSAQTESKKHSERHFISLAYWSGMTEEECSIRLKVSVVCLGN